MKSKIFKNIAAALTMGLAMASCSDNWIPDTGGEGTGSLDTQSVVPTIKNEEEIIGDVRGTKNGAKSRASINLTDFIVEVNNATGAQAAAWTVGTMPELPTFPVGTYTINVLSHRVNDAAWEEPYFTGSQQFKIENGKITTVDPIVCTLANIKVSVKFDSKLLAASNNGADFKVTVTSKPGISLEFTPEETRAAYFKAFDDLETLHVEFTGTVAGNQETTSGVLTNVAAGQHRQITFGLKNNTNQSPDENGNITIDQEGINVDFSVKQEDMTGNLNITETPGSDDDRPGKEEGGEQPTPPENPGDESSISFTSATLAHDENTNEVIDGAVNLAHEFGPEVQDAIVHINATNGVKNLNVEIVSGFLTDEFLSGVGMTTKFDLANADDTTVLTNNFTLAQNLAGLGFPVNSEVVGKTDLDFDITQFMPMILVNGDHVFNITVTDTKGNIKKLKLLIRQTQGMDEM